MEVALADLAQLGGTVATVLLFLRYQTMRDRLLHQSLHEISRSQTRLANALAHFGVHDHGEEETLETATPAREERTLQAKVILSGPGRASA